MRTTSFALLAWVLVLFGCGNPTTDAPGKNTGTSADLGKTDVKNIRSYTKLELPLTIPTDIMDLRPAMADSATAAALLLRKTPGCTEWVIHGHVEAEPWLGLIYDVSVTDDFERILNIYDKAGNKLSETVMVTNASDCYGPDRDCQVKVVVAENRIEITETFTRYTRDAVETPIERHQTITLYIIGRNGEVKRESIKERDLTGSLATEEKEENLSNRIVVYKNNEGHELRLEIMGKNHETLWYYDNGKEEVQVIPMIGENDYYALQNNEGTNIGFMQLNRINEESDLRIAAEIELTINAGNYKGLFKRSSVIE